ncbi:MAG: YhjD/YihY/BrkB family envelope integrity protein [Acidimicrobiales bacterium]
MRERVAKLRRRWPWFDVALQVQGRYGELQGSVVAGSVTLSLFLSLFPLLLFGTAIIGFFANKDSGFADSVVSSLGLTDEAASTVTDAIAAAQRSRRTATIVGLVGLLWSGLGAVTAMQIAVDKAWQAKGRGLRDKLTALVWLLGVIGCLAVSFGATALVLLVLPGWAAPIGVLVSALGYVALFWWTFHELGNTPIGWRPLLPGAIAGGVGFLVLTTVGAWVVPRTVASSSALYGSIGVVFALLAWLFLFGRLLVYASVLNVVLYERRKGTVTVEVEVPKVAGQVPLTATRGGMVDDAAVTPT